MGRTYPIIGSPFDQNFPEAGRQGGHHGPAGPGCRCAPHPRDERNAAAGRMEMGRRDSVITFVLPLPLVGPGRLLAMMETIEMNPGISRGRRQLAVSACAFATGGSCRCRPAPTLKAAAARPLLRPRLRQLRPRISRAIGSRWSPKIGAGAWSFPSKATSPAFLLTRRARKVATAWDPANDKPGDEQCKPYGAASIMRVPGRLHITWADANTLRIETDSGTQTRLLHFGGSPPPAGAPQWQGYSDASWEGILKGRGAPAQKAGEDPRGYLKVITTHMRPGYLRRNGIPYGADATLEEYLRSFCGTEWRHLAGSDPRRYRPAVPESAYVTHAQFKKIPDASGWDPTPCRMNEAR